MRHKIHTCLKNQREKNMQDLKNTEIENICLNLEKLRKEKPLVHNITNYVVMNFSANCLLALGASPVMAEAQEELSDMSSISSSLVINIGTLSSHWVESMEIAIDLAKKNNKPVILDPVGAGASDYRTQTAKKFLSMGVSVLRGNSSEIMALNNSLKGNKTKGVDSSEISINAIDSAKELAASFKTTVVISGETDYICSVDRVIALSNGVSLMGTITGMGCSASALIGAFLPVSPSPFEAAVSAMSVMSIAGEMAAEKALAPGAFNVAFVDALYEVNADIIRKRIKLEYA